MTQGYIIPLDKTMFLKGSLWIRYPPEDKYMDNFGPVILIEGVLFFGGTLLFAWWQLRNLRKEREKAQKKKEQNEDKDV